MSDSQSDSESASLRGELFLLLLLLGAARRCFVPVSKADLVANIETATHTPFNNRLGAWTVSVCVCARVCVLASADAHSHT